ncbi:adenine phosphoribosyltransferase [Mariniphaga anaerophila]|uniref:Adenine phosphoribosyltransferase n=1 Tax=Mariniphaga anaerophila TaxID=1484053 RepID=A0A1M5EL82_9BACT|nr:adenine phosphoribosyltransferase [Mariniphaga anaerophila]SHF79936.1 adenine phosphoribosyltransferase [Mariniphaga anaerophila]
MNLKTKIREIQDFPTKGISFKDITTLLKEKEAFVCVVDNIVEEFKTKNITKVLGIESRGFIFGGALAKELGAGFVPVRKKGKLPAETIAESYELEYGVDTIEMHKDALSSDDVVLIHDDLLATGGTANAVFNIVKKAGVKEVYFSFVCDLEFIQTPEKSNIYKLNPHILVKY